MLSNPNDNASGRAERRNASGKNARWTLTPAQAQAPSERLHDIAIADARPVNR
jgi:hypothetical protein